jgi:hypothetical protein
MAKTNAEYQARHQKLLKEKADFFKRVKARFARLDKANVEIIGSTYADIVVSEYMLTSDRIASLKIEFFQDDHL